MPDGLRGRWERAEDRGEEPEFLMLVTSWEAKCQNRLKDIEGFRFRPAAVEGPVVIGVHAADSSNNQQDED